MSRIDAGAAERRLLSILLLSPEGVADATVLSADDFLDARHAKIFEIINELFIEGRGDLAVDSVLLELERKGEVGAAGGASYLAEIVAEAADYRTLGRLIETISEEALRRRADSVLEKMRNSVGDRSANLAETFDNLRRELVEIEMAQSAKELPPIADAVAEFRAQVAAGGIDPGTPTGLLGLNRAVQGGLKPSQLIVLAGATGSGKTSLATLIALHAAKWASLKPKDRGAVLLFSYEMNSQELLVRLIAQATDLSRPYAAPAGFAPEDMAAVMAKTAEIERLPLRVEDQTPPTVEAINGAVSRWINRYGTPSLVVVDHIGLLNSPDVKGGNRTAEVGKITRGLKQMAMAHKVPVLALCQLSRDVEKRDDHRPTLSDLRESGSVEQDANIVLFVYRESYYMKDPVERSQKEEFDDTAKIMIEKNRQGPKSAVNVCWIGPRFLFWEPDEAMGALGMRRDDFVARPHAADAPSGEDISIDASIAALAAAVTASDEAEDLPFDIEALGGDAPPAPPVGEAPDPFFDDADEMFA